MPMVGKKEFPYTAAGKMAAKKVAKKTGAKMMMHEKKEGVKEQMMEYGKKSVAKKAKPKKGK